MKQIGSGIAKLEATKRNKFLDGTVCVEVSAPWINNKNSDLKTQALIVQEDGYAVTIATHTWEVHPPDKNFFSLKFE